MERPPMFMEGQNKYCDNGYIAKSNLQIQCNPLQNSNDILHRNRKFINMIPSWPNIRFKEGQCSLLGYLPTKRIIIKVAKRMKYYIYEVNFLYI
jgi:hypothetical protein